MFVLWKIIQSGYIALWVTTVLTVSYFDHASKFNTVVWQKQNLRVLTEDVLLSPSNSEWNMNVQSYSVVDTWPAWGEPHFLGPFWEPGLPCSLNTFHWLMWKVLKVIQCVIKRIKFIHLYLEKNVQYY